MSFKLDLKSGMKGFCQNLGKSPQKIHYRRNVIMNKYIERVLAETKAKNANEPEFLQKQR